MNKLLFFFLIFIIGCVQIDKKENTFNTDLLNINKIYSFEEYIVDLQLLNKDKTYPDINDIPN